MRRLAWILLAACFHSAAHADDQPVTSVEVAGIRNPEMRSYRSVVAGLDAFDEYRRLAPDAPALRFRFAPKIKSAPLDTGLQLRIVGKGDATVVAIGDDGEFSIPRLAAAYADDADVVLNRKADLFRAAPVVRTAGLAPDVLRLGDLRLNCQVTVAVLKYEIGFMARTAVNTLMRSSDWCNIDNANFAFPAPALQRIAGATLVEGERRVELRLNDAFSVSAPLANPAWSDDALIHLRYAAPSACANCVAGTER